MSFWSELELVGRRWNVLTHPFYLRWSAGELEARELAIYAGQYRHAVVALADVARQAAAAGAHTPALTEQARETLGQHASEEIAHVELWDRFTTAAGGEIGAPPSQETQTCVGAWTGSAAGSLVEPLAVLYAIESAQPQIAEVKRSGLIDHYGFQTDATTYFDVHATLDHEHSQQARQLLDGHATAAQHAALVSRAEHALRGNWTLLDGVERLAQAA